LFGLEGRTKTINGQLEGPSLCQCTILLARVGRQKVVSGEGNTGRIGAGDGESFSSLILVFGMGGLGGEVLGNPV